MCAAGSPDPHSADSSSLDFWSPLNQSLTNEPSGL